jgi:serine/threonine protein kinase
MPDQKRTVRAVFENALGIEPEGERSAYLDNICGDDASLRQDVDSLLQAYLKADRFLESPAPGLPETMDQPAGKLAAGQVIGSYKLREQLGVGGFGVVWAAQQLEPISRKVALKIIKPGMDSATVIARFEAERQALALMDHPNIARVLDAGTTETGHPYFVMELIRGVPITEYCDDAKLSIRQRLELFTDV